ncbi:hypothetical protein [Piscinibacterium candidicorallinum]|jgi:hypothetical protein|uniref:Uncharacterized protein n=1 Tax=Piscinibacterium candidicorallinum TaxID=1793872 RepID=A0ABV7H393_9BURK
MPRPEDREPGEIFSRKTQWGTLAFIAILLGGGPLLAWIVASLLGLKPASEGDAIWHALILAAALVGAGWLGNKVRRRIDGT